MTPPEVEPVVIVGAGPAGAFCAERLLDRGFPAAAITVVERGPEKVEERRCPQSPLCNCRQCEILEGVGGAGGLSDGKLTFSLGRGVQTEQVFSEDTEHSMLLDLVARFRQTNIPMRVFEGESREPLYPSSPATFTRYPLMHLGSDGMREFIRRQAWELSARGVTFIRGDAWSPVLGSEDGQSKATGLTVRLDNGSEVIYPAGHVVIATGLSGTGRWEAILDRLDVHLADGPAGFGLRIEADADVLEPLFDRFYDWKVEMPFKFSTLRSFCCNRDGYVVNENHRDSGFMNVNGHSYLNPAMRSGRSNFALIAKLPVSSAVPYPQAFVRAVARTINRGPGDKRFTKCQSMASFMTGGSPVAGLGATNPQAIPDWVSDDLPGWLLNNFRFFLGELATVVPSLFTRGTSLIYGPEVKYYGYRMPVDPTWQIRGIDGLHVVGNASGYIDSYIAAALSGMRAADHIAGF